MQKVSFDPGYSSCMLGVSDNIDFMYSAFVSSETPLKQKKFQFSILFPKLKTMLLQNVSFYLGCLLWAVYLKSIKDGFIENNPCLNGEYHEDIVLEEINFLIDFIDNKFDRDAKYYINQRYIKDERFIKVLEVYKEFIKLNQGFISIQETKDIKLPDTLKNPNVGEINLIKNKIDEAIEKKNLSLLFDVYELIFG